MNTREAMQALLDGKKLQRKDLDNGEYIHLISGELVWTGGHEATLISGRYYELYEEPNPHTVGTFAWAREENRRGRAVTANTPKTNDVYQAGELDKNFCTLFLVEIDSTNWKVVS